MARSLISAANENPIHYQGVSETPSVTMQITRLDPNPENSKEFDPRIAETINMIRDLGVEVVLGERDDSVISNSLLPKPIPTQYQNLEPSLRLNLDLSILVALVSDLTHSPLPTSAEDADARFTPSEVYLEWKKARLEAGLGNGGQSEVVDLESLARPSRALANQALQEMVKGLFQEIYDRLSSLQSSDSDPGTLPPVEFWTTPEAQERCLRIVSKIGGPSEKRRAQAMFYPSTSEAESLEDAEELFWRDSRYPCKFIPLLPIRLLPSSEPPTNQQVSAPSSSFGDHSSHTHRLSPFFPALAHTCRSILAQEVIPDPRTLRVSPSLSPSVTAGAKLIPNHTADENDEEEIQRATVTKANPRLTAHTVQSMLWGAVNGWTTLTANRTSVKAILREIKGPRFGSRWELQKVEASLDKSNGVEGLEKNGSSGGEIAALWVVDPRSLAEGMRFDFGMS